MKNKVIPLIAGLVVSCAYTDTHAQEHKETINKEFTIQQDASGSTLAVYNFFGSVKVEGYAGNKVIFKVEKTLSAKNNTDLETGRNELRLDFIQHEDSIIAFITEPFDSRPNRKWNNQGYHRDLEYEFKLDFTVMVPFDMNLHVITVNEGDIMVKDVSGDLRVQNVNGSVILDKVKGNTNAGTVNGNITVNYLSNPQGQSSYHTINGDIKVDYRPDLSADMQFKSMHGEMYTDFPDVETLPATTVKNTESEGDGTVYKLNKTTTIRIGTGGRLFNFETLNGNVYIKKQS